MNKIKLWSILMLMMMSISLYAQNLLHEGKPYYYYALISGDEVLLPKIKCTIQLNQKEQPLYLCDEKGEPIVFLNSAEVVNYFSKRGWTLDGCANSHHIFQYWIKKEVLNDEEASKFLTLKTSDEIKKAKKGK